MELFLDDLGLKPMLESITVGAGGRLERVDGWNHVGLFGILSRMWSVETFGRLGADGG